MALDRPSLPLWIRILIVTCCAIEAAFWLAPVVGFDQPLRAMANLTGAFWLPVFQSGKGLYPGQPLVMFLTYGLLHGGLMHLAMNMFSLVAVARELARFMRPLRMGLVYLVSQIAAALAFAWMSVLTAPMVGASGAIFGVAAALIAQAIKWRLHNAMSMRPIWRTVLIIGGLNIALTFAVPNIAWQAHLGGTVAGFVLGLLLPLRPEFKQPHRSRFPTVNPRNTR
ncbi:rhomboid family intramembrane serine protease [Paracoccus onubensis]|uniref:rhomboid family intramembrane serine protease n=1 Tax=Paracoccus onubensis TaxID=1675788 RepID=UPI0027308C57|nr:rhomboid family intramembrane serine protease [Paracoccus onubensis]MDP0928136.1 rhomboid family intramembrane serine protease [Paracoccus onubensis]